MISKKYILTLYTQHFWNIGNLQIIENNEIKEIITINRYYELDKDFFYIYDCVGGTGTGFKKGNILRKIYIGDGEFETITMQNNNRIEND